MTVSPARALLPKEHGAYGQLLFPIVTSCAASGVAPATTLLILAVVGGFLAHEPLLILSGLRGERARIAQRSIARRWLITLVAIVAVTGSVALLVMPASSRWSVAVPVVPAAAILAAARTGRWKSWQSEVGVAVAFSATAIPLSLAAGDSLASAAAITIAFTVHFVLATFAVRVVVLTVRGGGDPHAVATTRRTVFVLSALCGAGIAGLCLVGVLSWVAFGAALPGALVSLRIAASPPPAARLRSVGWTLVATSAVTAGLLIVGLRSAGSL